MKRTAKERRLRQKLMRRHESYVEFDLRQRQWKNEMIKEAMGEGVLIYGWSHDPQFEEAKSGYDAVFSMRRRVVKKLKAMTAEGCANFLRKWSKALEKGQAPNYAEVL